MALAQRDYSHPRWRRPDGYDGSGRRPPGNDNNLWQGLIVLALFIIAVVYSCESISIIPDSRQSRTPKVPQLHTVMDAFLSEQPLPENGSRKIFYPPESLVANFTIKTDPNNHYLVKLVDSSNNPVLYLFARANSIASLKVPLGAYELRWVCGSKWYGYEHLFGSSSTYQKALEPLVFWDKPTATGRTIMGRTVTFHGAVNGNLPSTRISSRQF